MLRFDGCSLSTEIGKINQQFEVYLTKIESHTDKNSMLCKATLLSARDALNSRVRVFYSQNPQLSIPEGQKVYLNEHKYNKI